MLRRACRFVVVCCLVWTTAAGQTPDDDARAQELYDRGVLRYQEGAYGEAIAAWEAGHALSPRPLFLFNLANAAERRGDLDGAADYLREYAAVAPDAEIPTITRRIVSLEQRMASDVRAPVVPPPPARRSAVVPVTAFSVAALGMAAGTGWGITTRRTRMDLRDVCVDGVCKAEAAPDVARQRSTAAATDVAFGVALVATGVGVGSLLLPSDAVGIGPSGVVVRGRFP